MTERSADSDSPKKASGGFWAELWSDLGRSVYDIRAFGQMSGKGFKYVLRFAAVLVFISAAAETAVIAAHFLPLFNRVTARFIADVESVEVKEGKLSLAVAQPYVIDDKALGRVVFDTSGNAVEPEADGGILVTDTAVMTRSGKDGQVRKDLFSGLGDMSADRAKMRDWRKAVRGSVVPLVGFFAMLSHVIRKLFHVLWLACAGLLYVRARGDRTLSFSRIFRLSIFSLTAPVALAAVVVLSGVTVPGFSIAYIAVSFLYAVIALTYILREGREDRADNGVAAGAS